MSCLPDLYQATSNFHMKYEGSLKVPAKYKQILTNKRPLYLFIFEYRIEIVMSSMVVDDGASSVFYVIAAF